MFESENERSALDSGYCFFSSFCLQLFACVRSSQLLGWLFPNRFPARYEWYLFTNVRVDRKSVNVRKRSDFKDVSLTRRILPSTPSSMPLGLPRGRLSITCQLIQILIRRSVHFPDEVSDVEAFREEIDVEEVEVPSPGWPRKMFVDGLRGLDGVDIRQIGHEISPSSCKVRSKLC